MRDHYLIIPISLGHFALLFQFAVWLGPLVLVSIRRFFTASKEGPGSGFPQPTDTSQSHLTSTHHKSHSTDTLFRSRQSSVGETEHEECCYAVYPATCPQVNSAAIRPGERGHVLTFSQQKESVKNG